MKPIDRVAARVTRSNKKDTPNAAKLRKRAKQCKNREEAEQLLAQADRIERASSKAKKAATTRLVGPKAVERAKKALEASKWRRDNA